MTNAPLRLLNRGISIEDIKAASHITEISKEVKTAVLFSDYGPDFEDHFRSAFEVGHHERIERAQLIKKELQGKRRRFRFGTDPVELLNNFTEANRYECSRVGTQFFVTTSDSLTDLIKSLKGGVQAVVSRAHQNSALRARDTPKGKLRNARSMGTPEARVGSHRLRRRPGRTRHAASAGRTRLVISDPRSRSTSARSYWLCRSSQNCGRLPK